MALESEPQSTPLGGSNLDALKSESCDDVDLEDGEIEEDDDGVHEPVKAPAPAPAPPPATISPPGLPTPRQPQTPKNERRRETSETSSPPPWFQRRHHSTAHKPQNGNKQRKGPKGMWGPPHKKQFDNEECGIDDDLAYDLEKALKAQIKDKDHEMRDGPHHEEDHWNKKKKKRKKHRDDDDERESKRHKRSSKDGARDEEDDEMTLFVRGASPVQHDMQDMPPYGGHGYDEAYDSYEEEGEEGDFEGSPERGAYIGRGRGRGGKMGRGRGGLGNRGRGGGPNECGRGGFSKRGNKRGGLRGGPSGKPTRATRLQNDRPQEGICSYFMQGKCSKGSDECSYSHDIMPPRKMELCKFYLMKCCAKREKCLYMHHDFPCKFFHIGLKCDAGEQNCRFSHGKLTDVTRNILLKHLETAPKEILGDFPRLTRESAIQMIHAANKARAQGLNPEDMDRRFDEGANNSDGERASTPMPTSPYEPVQYDEPRQGRSEERDNHPSSRRRDHHGRERDTDHDHERDREREHDHDHEKEHDRDRNRDRDRDRDRERDSHRHREHSDKREHRERKRKKRWDTPDTSPNRFQKVQALINKDTKHELSKNSDLGILCDPQGMWADKVVEESDHSYRNQQDLSSHMSRKEEMLQADWPPGRPKKSDDQIMDRRKMEEETKSGKKEPRTAREKESKDEKSGPSVDAPCSSDDGGESGGDSQDGSGTIPLHLSKQTRELFLRIQQQQQQQQQSEAELSKGKETEDSDDEPPPVDDWYSSDEDGATSLTDVLKNLPKAQQGSREQEKEKKETEKLKPDGDKDLGHTDRPSTSAPEQPPRRPPLLPTPTQTPIMPNSTLMSNLMNSSAIDKLLSSIRSGTASSSPSYTPLTSQSVPGPQHTDELRTPQGLHSPSNTVGPTVLGPTVPVPVRDPRLVRDPRSRGSALTNVPSPTASPSSHPDVRGDQRMDPRTNPRIDRSDPRSDPRVDRDPRNDSRSDVWMEPRAEPRTDPRRDPRKEHRADPRTSPPDLLTSPRGDPRVETRPVDPRAARMEARRLSAGSGSSTSSNSNHVVTRSIYDGANFPALSGAGDVDLRMKASVGDVSSDTDFHSQLGAGDMDMRRLDVLGASRLSAQDTDLRVRKSSSLMDLEGDYPSSHSDMDFRRLQMSLPFKLVPDHTPATEIDASLSSYSPRPYKVSLIDIPRPDFSTLKINPSDPQVQADPRLRHLFGLRRDEAPVDNSAAISEVTPAGSQSVTQVHSDPRRRSSLNTTRPADPRHARLSAAQMSCPPTPRIDDYDEPNMNGSDTDLRVQGLYGQASWESGNRGRALLPTPDPSSWMPPGRPNIRHSYQPQRSYTPPPS